MAKTIRQIKQEIDRQEEIKNLPKTFIAIIGDEDGNVSAGANNIYVRDMATGQILVAKNVSVPSVPGRLVKVEQVGRELYVTGFWNIYGSQDVSESFAPAHGGAHSYGGEDPIFITQNQITPFLVLPISGFVVQVYGGVFVTSTGDLVLLANQTVDLSAYQPGSGALYVLLEFDDTGTISVTAGSTVGSKSLLTLSDIPTAADHPLCAIRLFATQAAIVRDPGGQQDFVDPRFGVYDPNPPHNNLSGIDGGGDYLGYLEAYHLALDEWEALVKGLNADGYHIHDAGFITYVPGDVADWPYLADPWVVSEAIDELADRTSALEAAPPGAWDGDMTKAVYDTDNDGIVDSHWVAVQRSWFL